MTFRDYGVWQSACATIVLGGILANYYVTNDPVNYPVADLESKARSIMNWVVSIGSVERGNWDQLTWPYIAFKENFQGLGNPDVTISRNVLFTSTAVMPNVTLTVEYFASTQVDSGEVVGQTIIPQFTVFAEVTANEDITIKPLPVIDGQKENVQQVVLVRDYDNSIGTDYFSSAELPESSLIVVSNPTTSVVNVVINLAIDRPTINPPLIFVDPVPTEIPSDGGLGYPDPTVEPEAYGIEVI
jgi:hypothetical protein